MQEGQFLTLSKREFGHNLHTLTPVARQLVLNAESTYGVYLVTEEVDAERKLAAVGINIENAASNGKLTRLVDIICLHEVEVAQLMRDVHQRHLVSHCELNDTLVEILLRHHHFCQSIGVSNDIEWLRGCQSCQHLGTQYLVGCILLSVFHSTPVSRRKEESLILPQYLHQVVIEIARLVGIIEHEEHRASQPLFDSGKKQRRRRAHQSTEENGLLRFSIQ